MVEFTLPSIFTRALGPPKHERSTTTIYHISPWGLVFVYRPLWFLIIVLSRHSTHILMMDANNSRVIWRSWVWEHGEYKLKSPRQSVFQTSVLSIPKTMLLTEYYCVTLLFWESSLSVIISLQCWPALLFQHKHQEQL